jgi:hypothetical protein
LLHNHEQAQQALEANLSPRFRRIDRLERYVDGSQYEGRANFWSDDKPLHEREPCVVYPIVQSAITSTVDLCLGEGRWPAICAKSAEEEPAEDDEDAGPDAPPKLPKPKPKRKATPFDERFSVDHDEGEALEALLEAVVEQAKLKVVSEDMLESGMGAKSSVAIVRVGDGRLCVDTTKAKWCKATFSKTRPSEVESLEIRYPYLEEYYDERERKWAVRCMVYRRVIDAESDTSYQPAEAERDGMEPSWTVDKDLSVKHGFGFCPVLWYAFRKGCTSVAEVDGRAIHEKLLGEVDELNFALSQRHAAAMVAASPPTIEIGVDPDYNPAPMGRMPKAVIIDASQRPYRPIGIDYGPGGGSARKRGPGIVWSYDRPDTKVMQLTMSGDALKPIDDDARDLRSKIAEALGAVFIDPDNAKFSADLSGKALARLSDRQVRLCDKIRQDFGDRCLLPLLNLLLRVAHKVTKGLYLSGLDEARPILERFFSASDEEGNALSFPLPLDLTWGPYFAPDAAEEKQTIEMVNAAHTAKLITKYSAVEKLRDIFNIGNVGEYLEELEQEAEVNASKALDETAGLMALTHGAEDEAEPGMGEAVPPIPAGNAAPGGGPKGPPPGRRSPPGRPLRAPARGKPPGRLASR